MNTFLLSNFFSICDAPRAWGVYFQDSASPQMEALVELHDNIMFYLVIVLFGVGWILVSIIRNYVASKSPISNKYLNHGTLIELIWTITPALILIFIAFPSFKLLYLMDEVTDPSLTVFVEGHQWYWSYQYPDFLNEDEEELEFDSYLVPESDLEDGALRMLEVDNRVILPELTHVRFIITSGDVIHSYACPALGIKCDGEILHSSMPIGLEPYIFFSQNSPNTLPSLNSLDIYQHVPIVPKDDVPLSDLIVSKSEAILEKRRSGVDPSNWTQNYYKSTSLGELGIVRNSSAGNIIAEVCDKHLKEKDTLNPSGAYSPLDRLCRSALNSSNNGYSRISVYNQGFDGVGNIKKEFINLLKKHGH